MIYNYRLKTIWYRMKDRCYNKKHVSYKYYGLKGISICDEWFNSFELFSSWALSNGYDDILTLDRINGKGNYEPDNCEWKTKKEQQANRHDNRRFDFNGKLLTAGEISSITGINYYTEYMNRYNKEKKEKK